MPASPHQSTWTLRAKHARTTVLLHVDPLAKLSAVRAELLAALRHTHPAGVFAGERIPGDAEDVLLAKPVDGNDLGLGWEALRSGSDKGERDAEGDKGKVVAAASTRKEERAGIGGKSGKEGLADCPQGLGLKDGGVVAFKFRAQQRAAEREDADAGEALGKDAGGSRKQAWDVEVPSYDDSYGITDGGEVETT